MYKMNRDYLKFDLLKNVQLTNKFNMPSLSATQVIPKKIIAFNDCFHISNPQEYFVHFYIDDYQFERIWNMPKRYCEILKKFAGIIGTDFSLYLDMPKPQQLWNSYRNKLISAYLQQQNITVIPNISWSDADSFKWCFEGQPKNSVVALSTNGCTNNYSLLHFMDGYREMIKQLNPSKIIIYGQVPQELKDEPNIIHFASKLEILNTKEK